MLQKIDKSMLDDSFVKEFEDVKDKFTYVSIDEFPRLEGETDDAPRINRAIASITEGIIQLHNGVYTTASPIKLKSNVTLQGQNTWKTIIRNTAGTNIIETMDTKVRHYYIQVRNLMLDGVAKGKQIGLNLPHVTYSICQDIVIQNVHIGIYQTAVLENGTVTGAYYNTFYNPYISKTDTCIFFDKIANENTVFGGKLFSSLVGTEIHSNSVKFFGTCFEALDEYHIKLYGFQNSFYGPRVEGYNTSTGVLNDPLQKLYPNYIYSPHFQGVAKEIVDLTETLMVWYEKGINIPIRTDATSIRSKKRSAGSSPMVDMQQLDTTSGNPIVYKSKLSRATGKHLEGINNNDQSVFEINYYGEYEVKTPGRGIIVRSPDGSRWTLRISNTGVASWVKLP